MQPCLSVIVQMFIRSDPGKSRCSNSSLLIFTQDGQPQSLQLADNGTFEMAIAIKNDRSPRPFSHSSWSISLTSDGVQNPVSVVAP